MADDAVTLTRVQYDALIEQATNVASTAIKMGTVLSVEFEQALSGISQTLLDIIADLPATRAAFDGTFIESLVREEFYRHDSQPDHTGEAVGVRLTYPPTGQTVESYSKPSRQQNIVTAMNGLRRLVERRAQELRRTGQL